MSASPRRSPFGIRRVVREHFNTGIWLQPPRQRVSDAWASAGRADGSLRFHWAEVEKLAGALRRLAQTAAASPASHQLKDL